MNNVPILTVCPACGKALEAVVANPSTYHALRRVECRYCGRAFDVEYWTEVRAVARETKREEKA
jgi:DNA-directed RNA polymerase subunit RPC12/RpoP